MAAAFAMMVSSLIMAFAHQQDVKIIRCSFFHKTQYNRIIQMGKSNQVDIFGHCGGFVQLACTGGSCLSFLSFLAIILILFPNGGHCLLFFSCGCNIFTEQISQFLVILFIIQKNKKSRYLLDPDFQLVGCLFSTLDLIFATNTTSRCLCKNL